ncbi:NAD(P)H-dependent oxidoreductase [Streptomyces sp. ISL-98]|uniref:NADPH-dependent FMN reductase n=1 Tax=Streptomyces sp. ISL-98 TaxID=2819192 RepID=UPI001BE6CF30|nr:NADPH-dependent FMN reductase [Streptomyces sp. ISL-98]MBT2507861.1 NAD(P)H-dependent oxidoreductase [Streptomyces sp. ISL-98]
MSTIKVLMMCGSVRAGSVNEATLRTAMAVTPEGVTATLYTGLGTLPHFNPDDDHAPLHPAVADLRARIGAADALLFCTPEYAGALPGSFKNLLDWTVGGVEIGEKPCAWINVSSAPTGAVSAHESLRRVLGYTGARIVEDACARIPVPRQAVGADGLVHDPELRGEILTKLTALTEHATSLDRH